MTFSSETYPGVCASPSVASQGFVLNHSMLRVKDPAVSLDFYTRIMGMRVLRKPQGFGHICFSVPDLDAAVKWFDDNQVTYVKRPDQGKMKDVAFIKDADGYWIEIVEPARLKQLGQTS